MYPWKPWIHGLHVSTALTKAAQSFPWYLVKIAVAQYWSFQVEKWPILQLVFCISYLKMQPLE
jgi:hypothetical protein